MLTGSGLPLFAALPGDLALEHLATRVYADGYAKSHFRAAFTG